MLVGAGWSGCAGTRSPGREPSPARQPARPSVILEQRPSGKTAVTERESPARKVRKARKALGDVAPERNGARWNS